MPILILYARIKLLDGSIATGPVTTQDYQEFLFRNTGSDLDLYFCLRKNEAGWYFSNGPSIDIPKSFIDQVGLLIDQFTIDKLGKQIEQELVMR
jgi:hypothetical protein